MPISAARKKLYPANWKEIRDAAVARAGNLCELCAAPNGRDIQRHKVNASVWILATHLKDKRFRAPVRVVLTVHHINNDPTDNRPCNLLASCQRCHNKLDAPYRADSRKKTREKKGTK